MTSQGATCRTILRYFNTKTEFIAKPMHRQITRLPEFFTNIFFWKRTKNELKILKIGDFDFIKKYPIKQE